MKELLIVANWKMNKTKADATKFLNNLLPKVKDSKHEIVIAPSFVLLDEVSKLLKGTNVKLSAQNIFFADNGSFTGEVSGNMLKDFYTEYVILGHSERRQYFLESDEFVNKKVISALNNGLKPIICVGETVKQHEAQFSQDIISEQVLAALKGVDAKDMNKITIAYEPIWAIGSGKAMDNVTANQMALFIKNIVNLEYKKELNLKVLYGGSVNEDNAKYFFNEEHIDGALIGGAGLDEEKFTKIILG